MQHTVMQNTEHAMQYLHQLDSSIYIGEAVSQLEHSVQAAQRAEKAGHSEAVILASLFHDIGHLALKSKQPCMAELGVINHEWIGAKLLYDLGFSLDVCLLVGFHVSAKRYLAWKKPDYYQRLSDASKGTLEFQGGPMNDVEAHALEQSTLHKEILQVRVNDEAAKIVGLPTPDIELFRPRISEHLRANGAKQTDKLNITSIKAADFDGNFAADKYYLIAADCKTWHQPALIACYQGKACFLENRLSQVDDPELARIYQQELMDELEHGVHGDVVFIKN